MPRLSLTERSSGVLLHPTSLPGPHGSGDLGPAAHRFAAWLAAAGQRIWQMLPVVPPAGGNSPYQSSSVFAGDPNLISLELLHEAGLLSAADIAPAPGPAGSVDFAATGRFREERLRRAFEAFREKPGDAFFAFCERERAWLDDFALFSALKGAHDNRAWSTWGEGVRLRRPDALAAARESLVGEVRYHQFVQFQFHEQWHQLRARCAALGISLVGDIPIFVGHDSADVWADPHLFFLDGAGDPTVVAGVPPDYFSKTGQRWGNVLYRWDVHAKDGYRWWVSRFRGMLEKFDAVRVDHFIGFHRYWEIDAASPTAVSGRYRPGPGVPFFEAIERALGPMPIIAEDLGVVTPEVDQLRARFGFPGMKVLQFSFSADVTARHILPHTFPQASAVYTGTHDNNTTVGWWRELEQKGQVDAAGRRELDFVRDYLGTDGQDIAWTLIRAAMTSPAELAIIPLQDVLSLGADARMNTPGTEKGNWGWRLVDGELTTEHQARLRRLSEVGARTLAG
jgi:4-alpha-glucanotransferase